ncbi:MAG: 3-phosphoshikimate 1-carboxyvinyltransferase [Bacteroidia bacterium]|nr:MAG: 3-phosphoshikimate 1-carboxyvinyltransferase [Bacteroidia bacterium]
MVWVSPPPSRVEGQVRLPYSKSLSNRQLVLGAQTGQPFKVEGLSAAEDTYYLVKALRSLGYLHAKEGKTHLFSLDSIRGTGAHLYLGEGGTTLRFLLPFLARFPGRFWIDVAPPLRKRPILPLIEALLSAGAQIKVALGLFPIEIWGEPSWRPEGFSVDSSVSSQFLSALFLLAPHLPEGAYIEERAKQPATPSYREITRQLLRAYGWEWIPTQEGWRLAIGSTPQSSLYFKGEIDWSLATFFFAWAMLVEARLFLPISSCSFQPERLLLDVLPWPLRLNWEEEGLWVESQGGPIPAIEMDVRDFPDAAIPLVVVSAFAEAPSRLTGVFTLPYKETHRLQALATELARIGVQLKWTPDELMVYPLRRQILGDMVFESYGDHRMAMGMSLIAARSKGPVGIRQPHSVIKSFPGYWRTLTELGIKCTFAS